MDTVPYNVMELPTPEPTPERSHGGSFEDATTRRKKYQNLPTGSETLILGAGSDDAEKLKDSTQPKKLDSHPAPPDPPREKEDETSKQVLQGPKRMKKCSKI